MVFPVAIGDTVFVFDENRRVYHSDRRLGNGPIYREHFKPLQVTGETRVSWVLSDGRKVSKRTSAGIYDTNGVNDAEWVNQNRYRISHELAKCECATTLRQIETLLKAGEKGVSR